VENSLGKKETSFGAGGLVGAQCEVGPGPTEIHQWWKSFFGPYNVPFDRVQYQSVGPRLLWWSEPPGEKFYDPTNGTISPGGIWGFGNGKTVPTR